MRPFLIILLILITSSPGLSQQTQANFTLGELIDSIPRIMERSHIAGLMLTIASKDSVIFSGGFGYADLENKRKVDSSTLFRMGSITKMIVALGIMKLVEDGKLQLDNKLKDVAPEVPFQNKWESPHPVRIIHLLEHTSGFDDIKLNRMYSLDTVENKGIDMMLIQRSSMVTRWKPGERTAYSNPNYAILGYLIQKLSGKQYDQYLRDNILSPLEMNSSNFNLRSKLPEQDVKEYSYKNGRFIQVPSVTLVSGSVGSLWSNAEDMGKFLQLFLRNGELLFSEKIMDKLDSPSSSLAAKAGLKVTYAVGNYGKFLQNKYPFRGHDGILGTCFSSFFYSREMSMGFAISSNSGRFAFEVENLVVNFIEQHFPDRKLATERLDQPAIAPFLGTYQFDSPRNEIAAVFEKFSNLQTVYIERDTLFIKPWMEHPSKLVQTSPLTFTYQGLNSPLIIFTKTGTATVMSIAGSYYERTSTIWSIIKRTLFLFALSISFSAVVFNLATVIKGVRRRVTWTELIFHALPIIGVPALIWTIMSLLDMREHSYKLYELSTVNPKTVTMFISTSFFGLTSCLFLIYAIAKFNRQSNRWIATYLILIGISLCAVTFILFESGLLALRTWAM